MFGSGTAQWALGLGEKITNSLRTYSWEEQSEEHPGHTVRSVLQKGSYSRETPLGTKELADAFPHPQPFNINTEPPVGTSTGPALTT